MTMFCHDDKKPSHVIEITPEIERRVQAERRMSNLERIARLELDVEYWKRKCEGLESRLRSPNAHLGRRGSE